MNVLYLSNAPHTAGTARILQYWLRRAPQAGVRGFAVLRPHSQFIDWCKASGVDVLADPMPWPNRWAPWHAPWHAMRVARWAQARNVDVIHCNEHDLYPFVMLLKRFLPRPVVCHVRYRVSRGFAAWAFGGRRAPDKLLWTSHQQKADSAEAIAGVYPSERQQIMRLGVDLDAFGSELDARETMRRSLGVGADEILIGTPSPLRPRKRVEDFIAMIRRLAAKHDRVVGVVAGEEVPGDEAYRRMIERQISESGLGRRLQWVGHLDPIEPFHQACDISISTSEYETFGNSVCEAMACGKPVVGYRGGSVGEVVGDAGVIVETGDVAALSAAVEGLILDRDRRIALGRQARQRVADEFDTAKSLDRLCEIYRSLVPKTKAA